MSRRRPARRRAGPTTSRRRGLGASASAHAAEASAEIDHVERIAGKSVTASLEGRCKDAFAYLQVAGQERASVGRGHESGDEGHGLS